MESKFKIPDVTADIIMEIVEGVCYKNVGLDTNEAAEYIKKSKTYASRALTASIQLGIIKAVDSRFIASSEAKDVSRANKQQWPVIFRKFIQRYNPFILFVSLIGKGNSPEDAARKIKVIYGIDASIKIIANTLLGWGEYSQILKREKGKVELQIETDKLSAEYIRELLEAMEHDVKARVYIAGKLGEDVFGYMQQDELDLLVKAIREHQSDPRDAMDDCGKAFEDFLRRLGDEKSVNVSSRTGIQQLADAIIGKKLITVKHLEICKAINSFRIAAGHNKDKTSMEKWELNPDAAIECILLLLTTIRSIHNYVFKQIQMF